MRGLTFRLEPTLLTSVINRLHVFVFHSLQHGTIITSRVAPGKPGRWRDDGAAKMHPIVPDSLLRQSRRRPRPARFWDDNASLFNRARRP